MCLMSTWPNQEEFSSALYKFSTHGNFEAGEENQSASNQRYTLWPTAHLYAEPGWWLGRVFAHEIQSFPPSLSDFSGKLHLTNTKSKLLQCLKQPGHSAPPSTYDCTVLDDVVIVHCLPITSCSTFNEHADRGHIRTKDWLLSSTTKQVLWAVSMRQEGTVLQEESSNGQTATHQGCAAPTRPKQISGWPAHKRK